MLIILLYGFLGFIILGIIFSILNSDTSASDTRSDLRYRAGFLHYEIKNFHVGETKEAAYRQYTNSVTNFFAIPFYFYGSFKEAYQVLYEEAKEELIGKSVDGVRYLLWNDLRKEIKERDLPGDIVYHPCNIDKRDSIVKAWKDAKGKKRYEVVLWEKHRWEERELKNITTAEFVGEIKGASFTRLNGERVYIERCKGNLRTLFEENQKSKGESR